MGIHTDADVAPAIDAIVSRRRDAQAAIAFYNQDRSTSWVTAVGDGTQAARLPGLRTLQVRTVSRTLVSTRT